MAVLTPECSADSFPQFGSTEIRTLRALSSGKRSALEAMTESKSSADSAGAQIYSAKVSGTRLASDYVSRVIPQYANASVPLGAKDISVATLVDNSAWL